MEVNTVEKVVFAWWITEFKIMNSLCHCYSAYQKNTLLVSIYRVGLSSKFVEVRSCFYFDVNKYILINHLMLFHEIAKQSTL